MSPAASAGPFKLQNFSLVEGISQDRFFTRRGLLEGFDTFRANLDSSGQMQSISRFHEKAYDILSSDRARAAFDLDAEPRKIRERYGFMPRYNPNDDPGRPPDLPRGTEPSRLDEAKRALRRSIGGLREGATFNLVLYASDSWQWKSGLVEMDGDVRLEVLEHVDGLEAVGGTNLFGALRTALEVAGAEPELWLELIDRVELGEMPPAQLKETTMSPASRRLLRVDLPMRDSVGADLRRHTDQLVNTLMGKKAELRFGYIRDHADDVLTTLDV